MDIIQIDFSKPVRKMKPMHGVDNGPLTCNFTQDASGLFKEAGLPISRLHDTEYPFGSGEFVDMDCIFKCFNADENDPDNYNFALTDLYLKAILDCGTKIIYRLGCSIEHNPVKLHIGPPKDYAKWARIAEHIIRHYNEGWANGYYWDIRYWEIWNEPNHAADKKMWGGTAEDFARFYTVAATHLKKCFPAYMIGGPAFSNPESEFVHAFFNELTKNGARPPMDFYSWHGYITSVEESIRRAKAADGVLERYGYSGIESIYDEWNYVKSWKDIEEAFKVIQSMKGAAIDAAVMSAMQSTSCTAACYYDAQMKFAGTWCGLFEKGKGARVNGGALACAPRKPFYSFKAFNMLYRLGAEEAPAEIGKQNPMIADQVETVYEQDPVFALAAKSADGEKFGILLTYFTDSDEEPGNRECAFKMKGLEGKKTFSLYLLDEEHNLEKTGSFMAADFSVVMRPNTVALIVTD